MVKTLHVSSIQTGVYCTCLTIVKLHDLVIDNDPVTSRITIHASPNPIALDEILSVGCDLDPIPPGIEDPDRDLSQVVSFVAPFRVGQLNGLITSMAFLTIMDVRVNGFPNRLRVYCFPLLSTPSLELGLFGVSDSVEIRVRGKSAFLLRIRQIGGIDITQNLY